MKTQLIALLAAKALHKIKIFDEPQSIFADGINPNGGYSLPAHQDDAAADDWIVTITPEVFANAPTDDAGNIDIDALADEIAHNLSHYRRYGSKF